MSADLWIGIAIGSVAPWVLMIAILRTKHEATAEQLARANAPTDLLRIRNDIGMQQVCAIEAIVGRLEDMDFPLSDKFAAAALNGYLSGRENPTREMLPGDRHHQLVAEACYRYAHAMMFQRNNVPAAIVDEKLDAVLAERNALKEAAENFLTRESEEDLNRWANATTMGEAITADAKRQLQLRAALGMVEMRGE